MKQPMSLLDKKDVQLLTFLCEDCRSYKHYPHIVIAIEDIGGCGLSPKDVISSMDKLNTINAYYPGYDEYDPLFKEFLTWSFTEEERRRNKELSRLFFDIKLNVDIAQQLLKSIKSSQLVPYHPKTTGKS